MITPRPLPLVLSGLVFSLLALGMPLLHLGLSPGGLTLLLAALPPAVLVVMLLVPGRASLSHFAFPLSHLPLIAALPELAGDRIYGGPSGLIAFLAVLGAGAAYLVSATPRFVLRRTRVEVLAAVGLVVALAPLVAFVISALGTRSAPWPALTGLVVGPLLAWWLVAHGLARYVATPALDPAERTRALYLMRTSARPRLGTFVISAFMAAVALGLVAFFYLWRPG
jgi:hypothetical protein